jgi:NAD(P)-dependent dehydrogenase (short-subunit alcohol dehydrogenase family)/acyl carrier protein
VRARVLAIIADRTGYPPDMLDDGLDLEADLGVDTVKQAETFAAVRAAYDIPRQDDLKLREFPTIAHVVQFVYKHRPELAPGAVADVTAAAAPAGPASTGDTAAELTVAATVSGFPRRVPVPVLRPALDLCKPTGVVLGRGSRVVILGDRGGVAEALVERLAARGVETIVAEPGWSTADLVQRLVAAGAVTGVFALAALDDEGDPARLGLAAFRDALDVRVKRLAGVARALYARLAEPGTFVVAATRMGGAHGYDATGASAPLGGAVTGFVKALAREREAALCKAVDFAAGAPPAAVADTLIGEALADPGAVEIGALHGRRVTIGLAERALDAAAAPSFVLGPDSQVVVTGAAGSIVAAIVADLAARAGGGTFHLLDLAPAPDADDRDLVAFVRDREAVKRELFERGKARGERVTPAMIERELAVLERQAAAGQAIDAVTRAGGTARYHQVDLRDAAGVAAALADVRAAGRLDLVVHAAGLEISRALADKTDAELDRVFDVKADGWCNLIAGAGDVAPAAVVVFSSIAGRFGNAGQTDYSAANDLLCKLVSNLRRTRPAVRGVAIDWTAWAGIGMASRGSIPKVMELAGIAMLPAAVGVPAVYAELARGGGEVVIAGSLGGLVRERDPEGGLDVARAQAAPHGPMIGRVVGMGVYTPLVAEATLDPVRERFLDDHRIDGTAVLPGVMGIEGFAELASLVVPGARVVAVEHVRFEAPFKFYRDEPRTLRLEAWLVPDDTGDVIADCRLIGVRRLAGRDELQRTVHFTGRVRLGTNGHAVAPSGAARPAVPDAPPSVAAAEIYRTYFHGPAYQVLDAVWTRDGVALGRMAEGLPADTATGAMVVEPRRIELCFQTAGIWELRAHGGRVALPREVDELRWVGEACAGPVVVRVVARADGAFDAEVDDARGAPYLVMRGYHTIAVDPSAGQ